MRSSNYTIGLDLGDRRHHVCILNGRAQPVAEEVIANTRENLLVLSARFPRATFIMETGTHSPWVSRFLEEQGHRVLVANARKLRAICSFAAVLDRAEQRLVPAEPRQHPGILRVVPGVTLGRNAAAWRWRSRRRFQGVRPLFIDF